MAIHVKVCIATLLTWVLAGCSVPGLWVFEPAGAPGASGAAVEFDPVAYADGIWSSKVVPTITQNAVDAKTLLAAIEKDTDAAVEEYGIASESGAAPTFVIKGSGAVTAFDKESPQGLLTVDLGGGLSVRIVTGPVITGTALRDAMGIKFGEFTNQIDYQKAGTALNNKVKTEVIANVDVASLKGEKVEFEGAFALIQGAGVNIVPTKLTVVG